MPQTGYFGNDSERTITASPVPIAVGDEVRFGHYRGRVVSLSDGTAVVHEKNNIALGHSVKWRIRLAALTKC